MLKSNNITLNLSTTTMNIEKVFDSIGQIGWGIKEIYQHFFEYFYDNQDYRELWEEMLQCQQNQIEMLNRCRVIIASTPHPGYETLGKDINYEELLSLIEKYKKEIKEDLDINRALKIAFHMEVLEIQGIFNEIIKFPQEPYFEILTGMHLETRRSMGRLVVGIEHISSDKEFLYRVLELKNGIIERRSGIDRRGRSAGFEGADRREGDRRHGKLVKIAVKV